MKLDSHGRPLALDDQVTLTGTIVHLADDANTVMDCLVDLGDVRDNGVPLRISASSIKVSKADAQARHSPEPAGDDVAHGYVAPVGPVSNRSATKSAALLLALCLLAPSLLGCGAPQYPYNQPKIEVHKSLFGGGATISTDANVKLKGLHVDPTTGVVTIDEASLDSSASSVLDKYLPLMFAYREQQEGYRTIRETEWAGANQMVSSVAGVVGNVAASYIGMKQTVGVTKYQTQQAALSVLDGIIGGRIDRDVALHVLEKKAPEVAAQVAAALAAPATQPAVHEPLVTEH